MDLKQVILSKYNNLLEFSEDIELKDKTMIYKWLKGHRKPNIEHIFKVANGLNIEYTQVIAYFYKDKVRENLQKSLGI
jgi:transcriptional regulator with XRE-family HTH domain